MQPAHRIDGLAFAVQSAFVGDRRNLAANELFIQCYKRLRYFITTLIAALALSAPIVGMTQTNSGVADSIPAGSTNLPDYHPSLGDLMTMAVQPRHIKLGIAGSERNWEYARYELSELRNAFARIARTIPKYQTFDTAELFTGVTKAPLDALESAISGTDPRKFAAAYADLTNACNACHQSLKHAAIVVKIPKASMYSDQDFRLRRK